MQFYLALNRNDTLASYMTLLRDKNQRTSLTRYRLKEHSLAIEVPKENTHCAPVRSSNTERDRAALPDTVHKI